MSEQGLVLASVVALVLLLAVLGTRTMLAERSAGRGEHWRRPKTVRRLDILGVVLAVAVVGLAVSRVIAGLTA